MKQSHLMYPCNTCFDTWTIQNNIFLTGKHLMTRFGQSTERFFLFLYFAKLGVQDVWRLAKIDWQHERLITWSLQGNLPQMNDNLSSCILGKFSRMMDNFCHKKQITPTWRKLLSQERYGHSTQKTNNQLHVNYSSMRQETDKMASCFLKTGW